MRQPHHQQQIDSQTMPGPIPTPKSPTWVVAILLRDDTCKQNPNHQNMSAYSRLRRSSVNAQNSSIATPSDPCPLVCANSAKKSHRRIRQLPGRNSNDGSWTQNTLVNRGNFRSTWSFAVGQTKANS
ncbi:hypothetical protein LSAT2_007281 [Lamellibrachia satsuma]|nr:hypothetical protein LSAT2_007281 [Lamellibrachia satsuma]